MKSDSAICIPGMHNQMNSNIIIKIFYLIKKGDFIHPRFNSSNSNDILVLGALLAQYYLLRYKMSQWINTGSLNHIQTLSKLNQHNLLSLIFSPISQGQCLYPKAFCP
jgi:hypothetical protein